ncbi:MAG: hypothetical protein H7A33_02055 [Deltaproteobacteria bacterium]|nr:hypothetical protein [Deltaproteobacteria bacterium]
MGKLSLFEPEEDFSSTVVIVEDEIDDFELTKVNFKKQNFENPIFHLEDGADLLPFLKCEGKFEQTGLKNPVLIFLDVSTPRLSAEKVLPALKNEGLEPRIVLLTNHDEQSLRDMGLGGIAHIQKPLTFDKFYEFIMGSNHFLFT